MVTRERRNFERWNCTMPVDVDDYEHVYAGQVKNLGKGGAFVEADLEERPEIGQELFLTIPFCQGAEFLIIKGQVAWVRDNGVGVSFLNYRDPVRSKNKRTKATVPVMERYRSVETAF